MQNIFFDIGLIIIVATVLGYIARFLRQPLVPAYIFAGALIGPLGLGLINDVEVIKTLSEIGIAFLLFVVGMELELKKLKNVGLIATFGGLINSTVLATLGFMLAYGLGVLSKTESFYIALVVAFSSTMLVIKLLSDRKELDTLHGRMIIGILLMEDIMAVFALSTLTTISDFTLMTGLASVAKVIILILATVLAGKFMFRPLFKYAAKSQELLFLVSITMCFIFAFGAHYLGFSIAIGAFAAGVAIANLPYNYEIIGKVKPLRDFFSTLFFVSLGMELVGIPVTKFIAPIILLVLFITLIKPLIIFLVAMFFGYSKRPGFLTAISLTQISEFSLIIVAQGMLLGHISQEVLSVTIILATATITISSYFIKFEKGLYYKIGVKMGFLEVFGKNTRHLEYVPKQQNYDVILIGYDRIGYSIHKYLKKVEKSIIVVDFNPDLIKRMMNEKIPCIYGDIGDAEILERLNFKAAEFIISTIPEEKENIMLINKVKRENPKATIFVTALWVDEALSLYDRGADYVILPHFLGGDHVSLILEDISSDINKLITNKVEHIKELKQRKELGHHNVHTHSDTKDNH